tara:strand:- start:4038 stop:7625 length:3588 start_codon:yes stop_codon:yes gene_type:complete
VRRLQTFFINHPGLTLSLFLLLLCVGLLVSPLKLGWIHNDLRVPLAVDAIPDLGENQQIIFTPWQGRSPQDVEDQITYPLSTQLMGIAGVKNIRTYSFLGISSIYLIFDEHSDFYWSRSRIIEKLNSLPDTLLPSGVKPSLGPDATPVGQIYLYVLRAFTDSGEEIKGVFDLEELRTIQDFQVKLMLQAIPGVSEVASVGGFVQEFQIQLDPQKLAFHKKTLIDVSNAVRNSNLDVGAKTMEYNQVEYLVRGLGFVRNPEDLENIVISQSEGTPLFLKQLGKVQLVPAFRRGILDDAGYETVGGIVTARYGSNPMEVLHDIRERVKSINNALPRKTLKDGRHVNLRLTPYYDRTDVIQDTLLTLWQALKDEVLIASLVVMAFLFHAGSSLLLSLILPFGILLTFIWMKILGIEANVVALSGIAIAIGIMGDIGIILVENIQKNLSNNRELSISESTVKALNEVNTPILVAVSTTLISFLPVFFLTGSEGKLFKPLAYTKTLSIIAALIVALFLLPPLARFLQSPKYKSLNTSLSIPLSLICFLYLVGSWMPLGLEAGFTFNMFFTGTLIVGLLGFLKIFLNYYPLILAWTLRNKFKVIWLPLLLIFLGLNIWFGASTIFNFIPERFKHSEIFGSISKCFPGLGNEFMPKLREGSFLYMPTSMPHAGGEEMLSVLSNLDARIASIPEIKWAVGKAGRAESALDPAPLSMVETIIQYYPEYVLDRDRNKILFKYDQSKSKFLRDLKNNLIEDPNGRPYRVWRHHIKSEQDIWDEIVKVCTIPGTTSAPFLQPIEGRIVMLQSGMRAPMGIKIFGDNLDVMEKFGLQLEKYLKNIPDLKKSAVFADRIVGKPYLEVDWDREALARYGISIRHAQHHLELGVGGGKLSEVISGRNRFPVTIRFLKEYRDSPEDLEKLLISTPNGSASVPLSLLAKLHYRKGPQAIKGEDSKLVSYVLFDKQDKVSEGEAVERTKKALDDLIKTGELVVPPGVFYEFAGSYKNQQRANKRLSIIIPLCLFIILIIISLQFHSKVITGIIFFSVILAWSGGFTMIWLFSQDWFLSFSFFGNHLRDIFQIQTIHLSVAVWVGFLALFGIATDDGVLISTLIKSEVEKKQPKNLRQLIEAIIKASNRRARACLMTSATTILVLLPVMTSQGKGSEIMIPMAIPIFGGMCFAVMALLFNPLMFLIYYKYKLKLT